MKAGLILLLALTSQTAFSFETGKYMGFNANKIQICEMELIQNSSSVVLKDMYCSLQGQSISWATERELAFGHSEQVDGSILYTNDVSANQVKVDAVKTDSDWKQQEIITNKGKGKIFYHVFLDGASQVDVELVKQ